MNEKELKAAGELLVPILRDWSCRELMDVFQERLAGKPHLIIISVLITKRNWHVAIYDGKKNTEHRIIL